MSTIRVVAGNCDVSEIMQVIRMIIFYDPELDVSFNDVSEFPKESQLRACFFFNFLIDHVGTLKLAFYVIDCLNTTLIPKFTM